jgi:hypothetical protein
MRSIAEQVLFYIVTNNKVDIDSLDTFLHTFPSSRKRDQMIAIIHENKIHALRGSSVYRDIANKIQYNVELLNKTQNSILEIKKEYKSLVDQLKQVHEQT